MPDTQAPSAAQTFPQTLTLTLTISVEVPDAETKDAWVDINGALTPSAVADLWDVIGDDLYIQSINGYTVEDLQKLLGTEAGI